MAKKKTPAQQPVKPKEKQVLWGDLDHHYFFERKKKNIPKDDDE